MNTHPVALNPRRSANNPPHPEFIRLPKVGTQCPHFGLSRSFMNSLILPSEKNGWKPPVKSFAIRQRGTIKGVRLISFDSLVTYLRSHEVTSGNVTADRAPSVQPNRRTASL